MNVTKNIVEHKVSIKNLDLFYHQKQSLFDISVDIVKNSVTAFIGPSGCGKSSLLRCLNRMNDYIDGCKITGDIQVDGHDIYDPSLDLVSLRLKVGMVFQKPVVFPKSIYENVAFGPRIHRMFTSKTDLDDIVKDSLVKSGLWNEVGNRLHSPAASLSGGQQQRLCIARTIAIRPEVLLMDEPCSALDPIATAKIEELVDELKQNYTIIVVTHSMQQAARISDNTAFFYMGKLIEYGSAKQIFTNPAVRETQDYITGRMG